MPLPKTKGLFYTFNTWHKTYCRLLPFILPCNSKIVMIKLLTDLQAWFKRNRKKLLAAYLVFFVAKWSLTIVFGARIFAFVKDVIN